MSKAFNQYKKPALVLGGGGTKAAAFHAGVCAALQEKGFVFAGGNPDQVKKFIQENKNKPTFQTYIGSSAGAIICNFLAKGYQVEDILKASIHKEEINFFNHSWFKQSPNKLPPIKYRDLFSFNLSLEEGKKMLKSFVSFNALKQTSSLESLLKAYLPISGILSPHKIAKYFKEKVGGEDQFKQLGVDLFILCSKLDELGLTAFSKYKKNCQDIEFADHSPISEAIAASTAMPGIFSPHPIPNQKKEKQFFYDGAILEDLASQVADNQKADLIIMSNPVIPYQYHESKGSLSQHGIPLILTQAIYQLIYKQTKTAKNRQTQLHHTFNTLKKYLDSLNLKTEEKDKIFHIIEKKLNFKSQTKYIYIQPDKTDYEFFWADHISLNKKLLSYAFKKGYKAGLASL